MQFESGVQPRVASPRKERRVRDACQVNRARPLCGSSDEVGIREKLTST